MKKILSGTLLYLAVFITVHAQSVQWASKVLQFSSEMTSAQYAAKEVLGKPNVMPYGGQNPSAWTPDRKGKKEFIKVGYDNPIQIQQIAIAESANPSALFKVFAYDAQGNEHLIFTSNPMPVPKLGMLRNVFIEKTSYKVAAIKLEFDGAALSDFFSIDAVGISDSHYLIVADLNIPKLIASGILVERLDKNVNSESSELNPILSPDGKTLYFSRKNHPENMGGVTDKEDIWFSEQGTDGKWQLAKNMGPEFNNAGPNFVSAVNATPDGKSVVMILGNRYEPNGKMLAGVSISDNLNGSWSKPKSLQIENDYNYNEKVNYFMANTRKTLIMSVEREDTHGSRDLYASFMKPDSTWTEPQNLGDIVNSASEESAPFLANDNETLYFASSGFSGYGGADIYITKRLDDTWQNWTEPENLGPEVNSKLDDLFFNIPANSEYAYYSRGISQENADIFRVKLPIYRNPTYMVTVKGKLIDYETGKPLHAKVIFESSPDGALIGSVMTDPNTGEYSYQIPAGKVYTMRTEAEGHLPQSHTIDLRNVKEDGKVDTENFSLLPNGTMITVKGKLIDAKTGLPIYAKVIAETLPDGTVIASTMTDPKTGEYELKIPAGKLYAIRAEADGHIAQTHTLDLRNVTDPKKADIENFELAPLDTLPTVPLNTVLFEFNKAKLLPQSFPELNRIAELIKAGNSMKVEIAGHTDSTGDETYNLWLSQWRALAVSKYITEQGAPSERITVTFFGETKPVDTNDTWIGRNKNRRVELKIIKP